MTTQTVLIILNCLLLIYNFIIHGLYMKLAKEQQKFNNEAVIQISNIKTVIVNNGHFTDQEKQSL